MKKLLATLAAIALSAASYGQTAVSFFTATNSEGSLNILQASGALAGATPGGMASADTRTLYFWTPDLTNRDPGDAPGYLGGNWPYVFVDGSFNTDPALDAGIFSTIAITGGNVLAVNGYPVYQFINDTAPGTFNGVGPNWPVIGTDGTSYTQVPEASQTALMISALALGLAGYRRYRRQ